MYWRPETAPAWQTLWSLIRDTLGFGPAALCVPEDLAAHWRDPDLLLSQTCSLPFRLGLHQKVHLVGAFHFDLPLTPPGDYHSVILSRPGALPRAPRLAINAADSQSGWAALWDWSSGNLPGNRLLTGAHQASALAVAQNQADLCAIDAVTWALIQKGTPELARQLIVLDRTPPTPGLPLITAQANWVAPLQKALRQSVSTLPSQDRDCLGLIGFCSKNAEDYLAFRGA